MIEIQLNGQKIQLHEGEMERATDDLSVYGIEKPSTETIIIYLEYLKLTTKLKKLGIKDGDINSVLHTLS